MLCRPEESLGGDLQWVRQDLSLIHILSLAELVKAIDDFRSMTLTGQQQVTLDKSQQEIVKVIETVMPVSYTHLG